MAEAVERPILTFSEPAGVRGRIEAEAPSTQSEGRVIGRPDLAHVPSSPKSVSLSLLRGTFPWASDEALASSATLLADRVNWVLDAGTLDWGALAETARKAADLIGPPPIIED